jgi:hypothetical protein
MAFVRDSTNRAQPKEKFRILAHSLGWMVPTGVLPRCGAASDNNRHFGTFTPQDRCISNVGRVTPIHAKALKKQCLPNANNLSFYDASLASTVRINVLNPTYV